MWNTAKWGMASLAVALAIVLSGVIGYTIADENGGANSGTTGTNVTPASGDFAILNEIYGILKDDFVNPDAVQPSLLSQGAIDGVLTALGDPHTVYIPPDQYSKGVDIITGSFEGIGAQVDQDKTTGSIVIVAPFRESPAEKAGILPGDVLLAVDGESTDGWSVTTAVQKIRGQQGTPVELRVRHSDGSELDVTITRSTIVLPTVFTRDITDASGSAVSDLAYIELQQFTDRTVEDLRTELNRISQAGTYRGIVLDLRLNPGGSLDSTVAVADMFLDGGAVLTQVDRDGSRTEYDAKAGGEATTIPLAILVSKSSASGSEVLAGALRDHGRAKLIGEQTFGKGSVNHLRELSNGGALYVTIARWLTPNGEQIEGVGLTPDIKVDSSDDEYLSGEGPQLYAAIDYLRGPNAAAAQ